MSRGRKNTVRDKVIDKKWIALPTSLLFHKDGAIINTCKVLKIMSGSILRIRDGFAILSPSSSSLVTTDLEVN